MASDPLTPQSLAEWRAERDAEKQAEQVAAIAMRASDAALDAMANGCSGAEAYRDVSDAEFARMLRNATGRGMGLVETRVWPW